jgi:hypothetical protein
VSEVKSWRCSARAAVTLVRGLRCQRSAPPRPRAPSPTLLPVLSGLAVTAHTDLRHRRAAAQHQRRASRRFTRACLVEAPTHHADLALRAAATTPQRPSPPSAVPRCRQHLPSYHLPPPRRRAVRSSTPTRQPMLLGGSPRLPQVQPTYRRPRLCRRASPSARLSCAVQPPCRPRRIHDAPNHQQAQQSRRAGRVPATPTRQPTWQAQLGYAVASASSRSQRCIGEPAARRVLTSAAAVTGGPTSAGRAHHASAAQRPQPPFCPSATPALVGLRPAGAHQRGCAVAHAPRWQLEAAPEAQPRRAAAARLSLYFDHHGACLCAVPPAARPRAARPSSRQRGHLEGPAQLGRPRA